MSFLAKMADKFFGNWNGGSPSDSESDNSIKESPSLVSLKETLSEIERSKGNLGADSVVTLNEEFDFKHDGSHPYINYLHMLKAQSPEKSLRRIIRDGSKQWRKLSPHQQNLFSKPVSSLLLREHMVESNESILKKRSSLRLLPCRSILMDYRRKSLDTEENIKESWRKVGGKKPGPPPKKPTRHGSLLVKKYKAQPRKVASKRTSVTPQSSDSRFENATVRLVPDALQDCMQTDKN